MDFRGYSYQFTFEQAREQCEAFGKKMLEIYSVEELDTVRTELSYINEDVWLGFKPTIPSSDLSPSMITYSMGPRTVEPLQFWAEAGEEPWEVGHPAAIPGNETCVVFTSGSFSI